MVRTEARATTFDRKLRVTETCVGVGRDHCAVALHIDAQGPIVSGLVPATPEMIYREPVFYEVFDAMRRDELVLHLRLEPPALELDVLAAAVCQFINPNVAVLVRAPRPGLLARHLSVVAVSFYKQVRLPVIEIGRA